MGHAVIIWINRNPAASYIVELHFFTKQAAHNAGLILPPIQS